MVSGDRRAWLALGFLVALAALPAPAQEAAPPPPGHLPDAAAEAPASAGHGPSPLDSFLGSDGAACEREGGLFFTGEYLLLRAHRTALDFGVVSPNFFDAPGGTIESLDWGTRSGFRVGAGYRLPDEWQLGVTYTYFHTGDSRNLNAPPGGFLFSTLARGGGIDDVTSAIGSTSLDYDVIDLDAAYPLHFKDRLDLRLFGGVRLAWIDQNLDVYYNGGSVGARNALVSSPVYFRGAGPSVGGDGTWRIYRGLGLYARARGSLLSSETSNYLRETNDHGAVVIVNVREKFNQITPVADLGMGVGWQGERFSFRVGYEVTNWFDLIHSPDFPDGSSIGKLGRRTSDLTLEGLSVQLGLSF